MAQKTIIGSFGNDTLVGSLGDDIIIGGSGNDLLNGGAGNDTYIVSGLNDGLDSFKDTGTSGYDLLKAGAVGTRIGLNGFGPTSGIEEISAGGLAGVSISGSGGSDILDFSSTKLTGIERIDGGYGNDVIVGSSGNDVIAGGGGNDTLNGGEGGDTYVFSGAGDGIDAIKDSGAAGYDKVVAGATGTRIGLNGFSAASGIEEISAAGFQDVVVAGTNGNDSLDFSRTKLTGIERIEGGFGNDTITGSAGDDVIIGGSGLNTLNGGQGSDTYVVTGATGAFDFIRDGGTAGYDRVVAGSDNTVIGLTQFGPASGVEEISAEGFDNVGIRATNQSDVLDFSATKLTGIAQINGGYGNDTITGSAGDDVIIGGAGLNTLNGGQGSDTYVVTGATGAFDFIRDGGTAGYDRVVAGSDNTVIGLTQFGPASGVEEISAEGFDNVGIRATDQSDVLDFSATKLTGIAQINGGYGNDTISGSAGDDAIDGGAGSDILRGGAGNDTAVYSGNRAAYQVTATTTGFTVRALSGNEGSDNLTGFERIRFADGLYDLKAGIGAVMQDTIASAPTLAVSAASGLEDSAIALNVKAALTDLDGSESLAVTISGVPDGAMLSAGVNKGQGVWQLTQEQLEGLTITPPTDSGNDFTLAVTATSTEANNSATSSVSAILNVVVAAVADMPSLTAPASLAGTGNQAVALDLSALLTDLDGSESLSLTVSGLPSSATLSSGAKNSDGSWSLTAEQLSNLTMTAPDGSGSFTLQVRATATEAEGSSATTHRAISVSIADSPLTGPAATIKGTLGGDILTGTIGNDVINGGAGADKMTGGKGNDVYYVDNAGDQVVENYGEGNDTVYSSIDYALPSGWNVENVVLTGKSNLKAAGNNANNVLSGNSGDNALDGGAGNDTMSGGAGNDTYYAYDSGDVVVEAADGGTDTVHVKGGYELGDNVENVVQDATWGTRLYGNALDNTMTGNTGGDSLMGGSGNDTLIGAGGDDYLDGGDDDDTAVFSGNRDSYTITKTSNGISVTGTDGTDTLLNVEHVKFADQTLNLADIAPTSAKTASTTTSSSSSQVGEIIHPTVIQPSAEGDIVGFKLENNSTDEAQSGYVTFGQVFVAGDVQPGDNLVARINGVDVPVQMDIKATNADGSVRHAILTVQAPAIPAGGEVSMMLREGASQTAQAPALTASDALAGSQGLQVTLDIHNADGSVTHHQIDVATILQNAIKTDQVETWMSGPQASEFRVETVVQTGLRATFDIRTFADGTVHTDVIVANDSTYTANINAFDYDVRVINNGVTVMSSDTLHHNQNATWHTEVWNGAEPAQHVVRDVDYLVKTNAIPSYDTSVGVDSLEIQNDLAKLANADTGPMGNALLTKYMPTTGARSDLGPESEWTARYIMSQDEGAEEVMLANADAAGSIPWHFRDEATGEAVRIDDHPKLWLDSRGYGTAYGNDALPEAYSTTGTDWTADTAHRPSLTYAPYLFTGSHYYADELAFQAASTIASYSPGYGRNADGSINFDVAQVRSAAWTLRDLGNAAYILPDDSSLKEYFTNLVNVNLNKFVSTYIINGELNESGEVEGFLFGDYADANSIAPWQQDYLVSTLGYLAQRGFDQAEAVLDWMDNFISGRFLNEENGYNPLYGNAYNLTMKDAATGTFYDTWAEVFANSHHMSDDGSAVTSLGNSSTASGYTAYSKAALGSIISATGSVKAIEAFGYVASQTVANTADEVNDGTWAITPQLQDGTYLTAQNMHVHTTTDNATMTGGAANELLHGNDGDDLISGNAGIDMLFGGAGNDILDGGAGNDYLYGGAGSDTLTGGAGNDYLKGGSGADTFSYIQANGGHDVIADFQVGADMLKIAKDLNGNGQMTAADVLSHATTDTDGNVVLHLGNDEVTLLGVTQQQLANGGILIV